MNAGLQPIACRSQANPVQKLLAQQSDPSNLQTVQSWSLSNPSSQIAPSTCKPGHKWDRFLPIPEHTSASALSSLKQHLQHFFTSWLRPAGAANHSAQHTSTAAARVAGDSSLQDDDKPAEFTNSTWVPVLPQAIAWMMNDAEKRIAQSGVNLRKAKLLAELTSVSYCNRPNIKAWNCTR